DCLLPEVRISRGCTVDDEHWTVAACVIRSRSECIVPVLRIAADRVLTFGSVEDHERVLGQETGVSGAKVPVNNRSGSRAANGEGRTHGKRKCFHPFTRE